MTRLRARILLELAWLFVAAWATVFPYSAHAVEDPASLREAIRVLQEELRLAAKPQIYLLLDLPAKAAVIKGRGIELHRFPIVAWRASSPEPLGTVFRLRSRPPIIRPKAAIAENPQQNPIELKDMPVAFALRFDPPLTIWIAPPARENPWLWASSRGEEWWSWLRSWATTLLATDPPDPGPSLRLTLSTDDARSLAWSATDGLPVLIVRSHPE